MAKNRHSIPLKEYFVILLFLWYYSGITMFYHAHLVDGVVVSHSHPYWPESTPKGDPYKTHSHSKGEVAFIKYLNHLLWESGASELIVSPPAVHELESRLAIFVSNPVHTFLRLPLLRTPPAFC